MAKLVARLNAAAALWVRIQTALKNTKKSYVSKGLVKSLARKKKKIPPLPQYYSQSLHTEKKRLKKREEGIMPVSSCFVGSILSIFIEDDISLCSFKIIRYGGYYR